jgi:uncharacterized protein (TIGR03083 family)
MADDGNTWKLIHRERAALVDLLEALTPEQWATASLCAGWSVHVMAAHILAGAEQTGPSFAKRMAANGFRFNVMIDKEARRLGALTTAEIIARLRATTATTNRPPAPVMAMLGEAVVHGTDIRQPLGLPATLAEEPAVACLDMYKGATFPVGGKKRIQGLRLRATDAGWSFGDGPEVAGPARSLLLAMTGRRAGLAGLSGDGVQTLTARIAA